MLTGIHLHPLGRLFLNISWKKAEKKAATKIRKHRLITGRGRITTPQHREERERCTEEELGKKEATDDMEVWWLCDTYLASSTTSTSAWAVMGAFECAVSGSSAFSSPLVKLTTCTKDRLHVFKTRWLESTQQKQAVRRAAPIYIRNQNRQTTFTQNGDPILIS